MTLLIRVSGSALSRLARSSRANVLARMANGGGWQLCRQDSGLGYRYEALLVIGGHFQSVREHPQPTVAADYAKLVGCWRVAAFAALPALVTWRLAAVVLSVRRLDATVLVHKVRISTCPVMTWPTACMPGVSAM